MKGLKSDIKLPKIGDTYIAYDEGEVTFSSMGFYKIVNIINWSDMNENLIYNLRQCIKNNYKLFEEIQTKVVIAKSTRREDNETYYFIKSRDKKWFAANMYGGELDVDGDMTRMLMKEIDIDLIEKYLNFSKKQIKIIEKIIKKGNKVN